MSEDITGNAKGNPVHLNADGKPLPSQDVLERLKIDAEINNLNKRFYKHKEFYIAIIPILLGIFGLIFSWKSGYFDIKLREIKLEKKELQYLVDELKEDSIRIYQNYLIDSTVLYQVNEKRRLRLDTIYQRKSDSLHYLFSLEITQLINEKASIEKIAKDRANKLDFSNIVHQKAIRQLIEKDTRIIEGLKSENAMLLSENVKLLVDIEIQDSLLSNLELEKLKYKLIAYFKSNVKREWLGFKQTQRLVGSEYTRQILEKLILNYPSSFIFYNSKSTSESDNIAINPNPHDVVISKAKWTD